MISSMSRKGNCGDNAPAESLWSSLKVGRKFATRRQAIDEVLDWLFTITADLIPHWAMSARCGSRKSGWRASQNNPPDTGLMDYVF